MKNDNSESRLSGNICCFLWGIGLGLIFIMFHSGITNTISELSEPDKYEHKNINKAAQQIFHEYSSYNDIVTDYNVEHNIYIKVEKEYPSSKEVSFVIKNDIIAEQETYYVDKDLNYTKK